jgi:hypothetical protein
MSALADKMSTHPAAAGTLARQGSEQQPSTISMADRMTVLGLIDFRADGGVVTEEDNSVLRGLGVYLDGEMPVPSQ